MIWVMKKPLKFSKISSFFGQSTGAWWHGFASVRFLFFQGFCQRRKKILFRTKIARIFWRSIDFCEWTLFFSTLLIKKIFLYFYKKNMKNCPKHKSKNRIKIGFVKAPQCYWYKNCNFSYTKTSLIALFGREFLAIDRILKVSKMSVLN